VAAKCWVLPPPRSGHTLPRIVTARANFAQVMHHDQSLIYAQDYIRDRPEILVNRIVGHLQYLFEIKTLDGVLPRMNQVGLYCFLG
jgi:hypothetical protein